MFKFSSDMKEIVKYEGNEKFVVVPEGVEKIGARAFYECGADIVCLPLSLKEIGERSFEKSKIITIMIPKNVEKIGKDAFKGCKYLYKIDVAYLNKNFKNSSVMELYPQKKPSQNMKHHKFKRKEHIKSVKKSVKKSKQAALKKAA